MKYFLHIPKTAGTSLLAYANEIGDQDRVFYVYDSINRENAAQFRPRVHEQSVFFGHFSFGFHALWCDASPQYVTVLREPVERVASFYAYCLASSHHPFQQVILQQKLSLQDFVRLRLTGDTNNLMVRMLSGSYGRLALLADQTANTFSRILTGRPVRNCPHGKLSTALRNIERHFAHVGTVDRIQETADYMRLKFFNSTQAFKVGHHNATPEKNINIDSSTRNLIETENELDLELFHRLR